MSTCYFTTSISILSEMAAEAVEPIALELINTFSSNLTYIYPCTTVLHYQRSSQPDAGDINLTQL